MNAIIETQLRMTAQLRTTYGYEQFTLDHGIWLTGTPLPTGIPRGLPRACFHNAMILMQRNRSRYVYMEGFALADGLPLVAHHGWVWDLDRGCVIDNTWASIDDIGLSNCVYLGIPFRSKIVDRGAVLNKSACLFFDWNGGSPGWVLQLSPDEFLHPITSPYQRGGRHGKAVRQSPQRRTARAPRRRRTRVA